MITRNLEEYKLSTTKQAVTSFAGLPLLWGMARGLGVEEKLNGLRIKLRERGYKPAETILSLMGLMQAGGAALNDISLLEGDEGMRALVGSFPAANTTGDFLRKFRNTMVYRLGEIVLKTAVKVIKGCELKQITLDADAFFLESQKSEVRMNYEGLKGYNPVAVTCAELKMPLAGIFRPGDASCMGNLSGLLKRVSEALPEGIKVRFRSDSAGYQAGVVRVCRDKGIDFTITARQDAGVMSTIRAIPKEGWKTYESGAWENRETEIAETVHAFGAPDLPAYRMIVVRWRKTEPDLFDKDPYEHHAVFNSLDNWPAGLVLQFHRARQDGSENVNKELSGGFGLSKLPCREIMANAVYFQIALLANVVFSAMKHLALPESWRSLTIKTVRFRLIRLGGVVARRARYLWLKIPETYPFRRIFEEVRWRLKGLSVELAPL